MAENAEILGKNELALIDASELSLVEDNNLNQHQLGLILKRTPKQYVKQRPAKGGGTWDYVTGGYVKKMLNLMFGWDWDFEIMDEKIMHDEVIVKGKLTCRSNGKTIVKMQFGNKDLIYKTETRVDEFGKTIMETKYGKEVPKKFKSETALSIGNDLKAAATDCLKKCASEIGIANDIYNKEDFREVKVAQGNTLAELEEIYEKTKELVSPEEQINVERIIQDKEKLSYKKAIELLKKLVL
jgi:hypothetical protein